MLVNLLIPFAAYLLAEEIHASGILAAVAAGIAMSYVELTGRVSGSMRVQRAGVWNMLQFSFNGIMFVLLGEQLPGIVERATTTMNETGHQSAWWLLVYVVVINLALVVLRLLWVWLSLRWNLLRAPPRTGAGRSAELAHRGGDLGGRRAWCDHPGRRVDPAAVPA